MQSELARMSSAAEAKFRIDRPNSQPRAVKVIALDTQSERIVKELAQAPWQRASFLTASSFSGAPRRGEPFSMGGWLNDLAGRTKDLVDEVNTADLVVMVATAGENVAAAAIIGEACSVKHVMTTALILGGAVVERRDDLEDARAIAAACDDAGDFQRRRIHQGHAHGAARVSDGKIERR